METKIFIKDTIDEMALIEKLKELDINFIDVNIQYSSFKEYMDDIFERNLFKSDTDTYFGFLEQTIKNNIYYFHDCWEIGLSSYKALTFFENE